MPGTPTARAPPRPGSTMPRLGTRSKLGERLLHRRLALPLLDCAELERRYDLVSDMLSDEADTLTFFEGALKIADLERIYRRFGMAKLQPYEIPRIVASNENIARIIAYLTPPAADERPRRWRE